MKKQEIFMNHPDTKAQKRKRLPSQCSGQGMAGMCMPGSDQNKYLFLWENRYNLGCFFLLKSAFQGQKQHCKNFIKAFPFSEHQYFKIEIIKNIIDIFKTVSFL